MMNRRTFLTSLGAALAIQTLPKQLLAAQAPLDTNVYATIDPRVGVMWELLYAIDPQMRISINYKTCSIYLQTRPSKVMLVEDVLWRHNPISVAAFVNGTQVNFLRKHVEMTDHCAFERRMKQCRNQRLSVPNARPKSS